jgi:hypothetical protein
MGRPPHSTPAWYGIVMRLWMRLAAWRICVNVDHICKGTAMIRSSIPPNDGTGEGVSAGSEQIRRLKMQPCEPLAERESFTMMTVTLVGSKGVDRMASRAGRSSKCLDKAQALHDKPTSSRGVVWCKGSDPRSPCDVKTSEPKQGQNQKLIRALFKT